MLAIWHGTMMSPAFVNIYYLWRQFAKRLAMLDKNRVL